MANICYPFLSSYPRNLILTFAILPSPFTLPEWPGPIHLVFEQDLSPNASTTIWKSAIDPPHASVKPFILLLIPIRPNSCPFRYKILNILVLSPVSVLPTEFYKMCSCLALSISLLFFSKMQSYCKYCHWQPWNLYFHYPGSCAIICAHFTDPESWLSPSTKLHTPYSFTVEVVDAIDADIWLQGTVTRYFGIFSSLSISNK